MGQTAPNPVLSTIEALQEEYEEHIRYKYCRAGVVQISFISPCENACPANVNIPGYLALISSGRFIDAYELIKQENPYWRYGRICTHPCEDKCRRATIDEALAICDLKRFVSDYALNNSANYLHQDIFLPKNSKRVAIIGAGASV